MSYQTKRHRIYVSILLIVSPILLIISCGEAGKSSDNTVSREQLVALEKEVIDIHDEVMPRLTEMSSLITKLEEESKNEALEAFQQDQVRMAIKLLKDGDSLMWLWMHEYNKPEDVTLDSLHTWLLEEHDRIRDVRGAMLESIRNANALLQLLGHGQPH